MGRCGQMPRDWRDMAEPRNGKEGLMGYGAEGRRLDRKVSWRVWSETWNDTAEKPRKTAKTGSVVPLFGSFRERHIQIHVEHGA